MQNYPYDNLPRFYGDFFIYLFFSVFFCDNSMHSFVLNLETTKYNDFSMFGDIPNIEKSLYFVVSKF